MHHARAEQKGALGSSGCAQVLTYIHHLNAADYEPVSAVNTIVMHFLTRMQVPLCVGVLGLFGRRACNWLSCSSRALQHSRREDDRWGKRALSQWRESVARAARMKQPLIEFYFKPEQQTAGFKRLGFKTRPAWELGDSIRKKSVKYWLTKKKSMNCFKCSIIELHLCCSFWVILDKYEHFSVTRIYTGMIHDGVSKVDDVSFKWIFFLSYQPFLSYTLLLSEWCLFLPFLWCHIKTGLRACCETTKCLTGMYPTGKDLGK